VAYKATEASIPATGKEGSTTSFLAEC